MISFPLRQREATEDDLRESTRCFSSTACDQDASQRVFRLIVVISRDDLRLRVSAGFEPAFPTAGVMSGARAAYLLSAVSRAPVQTPDRA